MIQFLYWFRFYMKEFGGRNTQIKLGDGDRKFVISYLSFGALHHYLNSTTNKRRMGFKNQSGLLRFSLIPFRFAVWYQQVGGKCNPRLKIYKIKNIPFFFVYQKDFRRHLLSNALFFEKADDKYTPPSIYHTIFLIKHYNSIPFHPIPLR